MSTFKHIGPTF